MTSSRQVTDKDGNKRHRTNEASLANSNVTRPAPLDADKVEQEDINDDDSDGDDSLRKSR